MKYLLLIMILIGCSKATRSYHSESYYRKFCEKECKDKYNTELDWVGSLSGTCYCK